MALFKTSKEAREMLEVFRKTGIRPNLWARAALGYSLSLEAVPELIHYDSEGTEFQEPVFYGEDTAVLRALLRQRLGRAIKDDEIGSLIKVHVERGIRHFSKEFERLNRRGDELLLYLLELCSAPTRVEQESSKKEQPKDFDVDSYKVDIALGSDVKTGKALTHRLNGPGSAPHVAIMGRNGTGKTRTGLSILSSIAASTPYPIPFLIFDYAKGDIAENQGFVRQTNASVITLPGTRIPLVPLSLPYHDEHAVLLAALRFRDTVRSVVHLGPIQSERCLKIIKDAYSIHVAMNYEGGTPDLEDLTRKAEDMYSEEGWSDDSLIACFREFTNFPLFKRAADGVNHDFFNRSHIIDIHRLPEVLRKLSAFLVLDRLYSEIMILPDAPLDKDNNRQLRLIIVIDEAHHFLPCKQPTLENIVREVRSKGVAVMLLSQSPDDFDQGKYNFAHEMGLAVAFSCVLEKPKMLEAVLGGAINPRRLSQLSPGVALTRVSSVDEPVEVQAWKP
jgi:DNA sulfur modification protein DndE